MVGSRKSAYDGERTLLGYKAREGFLEPVKEMFSRKKTPYEKLFRKFFKYSQKDYLESERISITLYVILMLFSKTVIRFADREQSSMDFFII